MILSTRRTTEFAVASMQLQHFDRDEMDRWIIERYRVMYDAFFHQHGLVPAGQMHEVTFEDLERDPLGQVAVHLPEEFRLPDFDVFRPRLESYLRSVKDYRKNRYPTIEPSVRARVADAWRRSFSKWGYAA